jgi:hypothetical protein
MIDRPTMIESPRALILGRLHFWSQQVALTHKYERLTSDGWILNGIIHDRIRFAIAIGQFQGAQASAALVK